MGPTKAVFTIRQVYGYSRTLVLRTYVARVLAIVLLSVDDNRKRPHGQYNGKLIITCKQAPHVVLSSRYHSYRSTIVAKKKGKSFRIGKQPDSVKNQQQERHTDHHKPVPHSNLQSSTSFSSIMLTSFSKKTPKKEKTLQQRLVEVPAATSRHLSREEAEEGSAEMTHSRDKATPMPSRLKRFRVQVPSSMDAGEIMNIQLDNITTKILITAPTSQKTTRSKNKVVLSAPMKHDTTGRDSAPPSPTPTAGSNTTISAVSSSVVHTPLMNDKYATPCSRLHDHDYVSRTPTSSKISASTKGAERASNNSVLVSTDIRVPEGKRLVDAKAVVVIHAVFSQPDKTLKEAMVDEVLRYITQEALDCECNAMLGMTITIKSLGTSNSPESGFLVKASGTPCKLLPTQVVVSSSRSGQTS